MAARCAAVAQETRPDDVAEAVCYMPAPLTAPPAAGVHVRLVEPGSETLLLSGTEIQVVAEVGLMA